MSEQGDEFIFRCANGTVKLAGKGQEVRTSVPTRNLPDQGEVNYDEIQREADGSDPAEQQSGSFPSPRKYIDVVRRTNTTLEVLLECRLNDCWIVDGDRMLLGPRTGFTQFTTLSEKPPNGSRSLGRDSTKVQATSRPDCLWREVRSNMSKSSQNKEKRHWTMDKPKLDRARKFSGIYNIDPNEMDFKDPMKHARKKLELPLESSMPCKPHSAN